MFRSENLVFTQKPVAGRIIQIDDGAKIRYILQKNSCRLEEIEGRTYPIKMRCSEVLETSMYGGVRAVYFEVEGNASASECVYRVVDATYDYDVTYRFVPAQLWPREITLQETPHLDKRFSNVEPEGPYPLGTTVVRADYHGNSMTVTGISVKVNVVAPVARAIALPPKTKSVVAPPVVPLAVPPVVAPPPVAADPPTRQPTPQSDILRSEYGTKRELSVVAGTAFDPDTLLGLGAGYQVTCKDAIVRGGMFRFLNPGQYTLTVRNMLYETSYDQRITVRAPAVSKPREVLAASPAPEQAKVPEQLRAPEPAREIRVQGVGRVEVEAELTRPPEHLREVRGRNTAPVAPAAPVVPLPVPKFVNTTLSATTNINAGAAAVISIPSGQSVTLGGIFHPGDIRNTAIGRITNDCGKALRIIGKATAGTISITVGGKPFTIVAN